jgi:hypothetical protein
MAQQTQCGFVPRRSPMTSTEALPGFVPMMKSPVGLAA